ncbi:MAG: 8-oxo-dGTP diphosphatase [Acutalibacter sp.]|nr:8-oxo-dGTP diphosphatase [Acutalibacter sp.]MCI8920864.1 8-oxo-dGTP diphosphatase [Acutalibacter sp.]
MSREVAVELTNMCMVADGTKVLVQDRVGRAWSGITFPGGHVEPGESITASVIREVKEETGLTIESPKLCGVKDWTREDGSRYMVLLFKAEKFSGSLASSREGNVFWAERSQLPHMNLARSMRETIEVLLDDTLSELYYTVYSQITDGSHWVLQ